jgi:hypothetical protein
MKLSHCCAIAALLLLAAGCKNDDIPKVYDVPALIQPYVEAFEQEAALRGRTLDIDNLKVEFQTNLQGGDAAGLCTFATSSNPTPHIRLDTTSYNWQNNLYHRELLVFHELGHCILDRLHKDNSLPVGNYASMMRSTGEQVYGGKLNAFKRDYYLDELFDENVALPDWATSFPAYASIDPGSKEAVFTENFSNNFNSWSVGSSAEVVSRISGGLLYFESKAAGKAFFLSKTINLDASRNFEIEASIRFVSGQNSAMLQWGGSGSGDLYFYGFTPDSSAFVGNWTEGVSASRAGLRIAPAQFTKFTIRRIGQWYYLYLNEEIYDVLSFESFYGNLFAFYIGPQSAIEVDYLRFSHLP